MKAQGAALPAAGAARAGGDAATPAAPLQRPTLRVQGQDIILEDGSVSAAADPLASTPGAGLRVGSGREGAPPASPAVPPLELASARLPSQATLGSMQAHASGTVDRRRRHQRQQQEAEADVEPKANGALKVHVELGASPGSQASPPGAQLSPLTAENMQLMGRSERFGARPETSERLWRWLAGAGPPYESSPSVGVNSKAAALPPAAAKPPRGRRRAGCFLCFG